MTAPPDLREYDEKIGDVRQRKEAAIDGQDFEAAARLRDEEKQPPPAVPSARSSGVPATSTRSPRSTRS